MGCWLWIIHHQSISKLLWIVRLPLILIHFLQLIYNQIAFFMSYPSMKAKVYMSYFNLSEHQIEDLYRDFNARLMEHTKQEARIQESSYENISQQKYGRFFEITSNAPSNLHYLVTDQKITLCQGVVFSATPNYDSLFPAIQYIKNDLRQLTESLVWR